MKKIDKEKLSGILSSDRARMVFVLVGLGAVLLIFLSSQLGGNESSTQSIQENFSSEAYCRALKEEIVEMIENIEGTGKAQVLLTLESSYEYIYLNDDKTLTKILEPKVRGVAVACTGGDNPVVKEKVIKMLTTVLSVSTNSISVSKLT